MTLCVLNQTLESRLKITLPEDMGEALANGTILCQLVNHIRPRSVSIIHIPSPAVVSLEALKRNMTLLLAVESVWLTWSLSTHLSVTSPFFVKQAVCESCSASVQIKSARYDQKHEVLIQAERFMSQLTLLLHICSFFLLPSQISH